MSHVTFRQNSDQYSSGDGRSIKSLRRGPRHRGTTTGPRVNGGTLNEQRRVKLRVSGVLAILVGVVAALGLALYANRLRMPGQAGVPGIDPCLPTLANPGGLKGSDCLEVLAAQDALTQSWQNEMYSVLAMAVLVGIMAIGGGIALLVYSYVRKAPTPTLVPVAAVPVAPTAPAGWYPTSAPGASRYWDGTSWGEIRQADARVPPA